jgi:hypothetical protein
MQEEEWQAGQRGDLDDGDLNNSFHDDEQRELDLDPSADLDDEDLGLDYDGDFGRGRPRQCEFLIMPPTTD